MPLLPPMGPLGPSLPSLPGVPLPGIPRPDFGAIFDQAAERDQTAKPAASPLPLMSSGKPSTLLPPASSLGAPSLGPAASAPSPLPTRTGAESIVESVGNYLGSVNQLIQDSEALQRDLAMGKDVELHDVMIAAEKASVAVSLTMQMRNKLVEAYQEVMRMQV